MSTLPFAIGVRARRGGRTYEARVVVHDAMRGRIAESLDCAAHRHRRRSTELSRAYSMAARLFDNGRNSFNTGGLNYTGDAIKAMLLDTSANGTFIKQITNATNANPVVYSSTLNPTNNDVIVVGGIVGNLSANQTGLAAASGGASFSLTTLEGVNVAGSGAWVSGGYAVNLTQAVFVAGILGNRVGTDQTLIGKTSSRGIANATSPISWPTVPAGNPVQAVIIYDAAGGADASNRLIMWNDGRVRLKIQKAVIAGDTTIITTPLDAQLWDGVTGPAPVIFWSDGHNSTLNAAAAQSADSITVTAQAAGGVALDSTADVPAFGAGLPVTPSGGTIQQVIGIIRYPTLPTGLYVL
jgi:hypothetical protein